jgi:Protein of unknown function (DUF3752)
MSVLAVKFVSSKGLASNSLDLPRMTSVGPQLPSSSAVKRKRDEQSDTVDDRSDTSTPSQDRSLTPNSSVKRSRAIGPTLPPASLDERPPSEPDGDSDTSSDDDDFGPSLPGAGESTVGSAVEPFVETGPQVSSKSQRDEWMIVPPSSGDWSARVDPTKLKARKFNTGKGANAESQSATIGGGNKWTETPMEKRARLEREMMGISDKTTTELKAPLQDTVKADTASQKLREYTVRKSKDLYLMSSDVMTGENSRPITI